ncbi:MAG: hypothetical protein ACP5MU_00780 [Thermoplasmata archaeon]
MVSPDQNEQSLSSRNNIILKRKIKGKWKLIQVAARESRDNSKYREWVF